MALIKRWLLRIFAPINTRTSKDNTAKKYRCVTIQFLNNQACEVVRQIESHSFLSSRASALVETKKRFLLREAPLLPLAGCTMKYCKCRYIHYEDRRQRERRHFYDPREGSSALIITGSERRSRIDRRRAQ